MYYSIFYTPHVLVEFVGIYYYISLLVDLVCTSEVYNIYMYILPLYRQTPTNYAC